MPAHFPLRSRRGWPTARPWALLLCGCAAIGLVGAGDSEPVLLRWKLTPGLKQNCRMTLRDDHTVRVLVLPHRVRHFLSVDYAAEVSKVDAAGVAQVEVQVRRVRTTLGLGILRLYDFDSATGDAEFDTSRRGFDELHEFHRKLSAAKFTAHIDQRGRIHKLDGIDQFIPPETSEEERDWITKELPKRLVQVIEFPEGPVRTGDRWSEKQSIEFPGIVKLDLKVDRELGDVEEVGGRACRVIRTTGKVDVELDPESRAQQKTGLQIDVEDPEGTVWFDTAAGRVVRAEATLRFQARASRFSASSVTSTVLEFDLPAEAEAKK